MKKSNWKNLQVSVPKVQLRGDEPLTIFQLSMATIVWSAGSLVATLSFLLEMCSGRPETKVVKFQSK